MPLLRHFQALETPLSTNQNSGQLNVLGTYTLEPFAEPVCPYWFQHTKEAGDYETAFHRQSQQGPHAAASSVIG